MSSLVPFSDVCSDVLTCRYSFHFQGLHIGKLYDGHGAIVEEILDLDEPGQGSPQDIASSLEGKSDLYKF